jgi:hypothetical protein
VIHVYAFADDLRGLPAIRGIEGAPLECISVDDVFTVYSRREAPGSAERVREEAREHGAVVDALVSESAAVVPVRFGELAEDAQALHDSVRARVESIRRSFDHVRGCVEVGLRVWAEAETTPTATTGSEYLRAHAGRQHVVDALHSDLERCARDVRLDNRPRIGSELFSAAYLVEGDRLGEVAAVVDRFGGEHPELTVVCTGPWAPYSFGEVSA